MALVLLSPQMSADLPWQCYTHVGASNGMPKIWSLVQTRSLSESHVHIQKQTGGRAEGHARMDVLIIYDHIFLYEMKVC
jgi:hypothetical protein